MSITEDWGRLKTEIRQDAERLISRTLQASVKKGIQVDLAAVPRMPEPTSDEELPQRRNTADALRRQWRIAVMENERFSD